MQSDDAASMTVAEIIEQVRPAAGFLSGVTVSGGEATLQHAFVHALFDSIKQDAELGHLTTLVDTNGHAGSEIWDELSPVMDGAMVDLKAFDSDAHQRMTTRRNDRVLASIRYLSALGKLHEVRLMVVPGENDDSENMVATAAWLHDVDPDMRIKLIGYRPHGVRPEAADLRAATPEDLEPLRDILEQKGFTRLTTV